jgi:hypothetical protein
MNRSLRRRILALQSGREEVGSGCVGAGGVGLGRCLAGGVVAGLGGREVSRVYCLGTVAVAEVAHGFGVAVGVAEWQVMSYYTRRPSAVANIVAQAVVGTEAVLAEPEAGRSAVGDCLVVLGPYCSTLLLP